MKIKALKRDFTVCQLNSIKDMDTEDSFYFIGKTDEELSLVCETKETPAKTVKREDGWCGFKIEGSLDFSFVGILSKLSGILAEEQIGIFAVSTYNTDYIFVKKENEKKTVFALAKAGYEII